MNLRIVVVSIAALGLAACAGVPVRPPLQTVDLAPAALVEAQARLAARETAVRALPQLAFSGRVAMANGRDGGSGRIDWLQTGVEYRVTLSAPVTRQSWQLHGGPQGARLDGLDGGPREGADVGHVLREATGFEIPVAAMAAWAAGTRADAAVAGPAQVAFDAGGRLARVQQDGWTIEYLQWQPEPTAGAAPALPTRLDARRGDARVRLVVDSWTPGAAADAPSTP